MFICHIHTLQTGGCGPRHIKFCGNISGMLHVNTDTEEVNENADSSSHNRSLSLRAWGVLGNSIS